VATIDVYIIEVIALHIFLKFKLEMIDFLFFKLFLQIIFCKDVFVRQKNASLLILCICFVVGIFQNKYEVIA